jgi:glycosyltransferase involved in cell wall biosynthesis
MQPPRLTVIIPAYNVAPYVQRCLESILRQGVDEALYEVVVIDDGSSDDSVDVVRRVAARATNVHIHSFENGGLSAARNRGTRLAQGEYLWYVDADDWLPADAFKRLWPHMEAGYDVIGFGYTEVYADGTTTPITMTAATGTGPQLLPHYRTAVSACRSIYRRAWATQSARDFAFVEGIYHEDNEFVPRIVYQAVRACTLDEQLYNYNRANPGSIITVPKLQRSHDLLLTSRAHLDFQQQLTAPADRAYFIHLAAIEMHAALRWLRAFDRPTRRQFLADAATTLRANIADLAQSPERKYRLIARVGQHLSLSGYCRLMRLWDALKRS